MDLGYRYSLDGEAVSALMQCSRRERRLLLESFDRITRTPNLQGDFAVRDNAGRDLQLLDLGDFVITFWTDHAVKMVRILVVERV